MGIPPGCGEPVFDKLHADLAKAMMSINAAKGFQVGNGFAAAALRGSQNNDAFVGQGKGGTRTRTNRSGGVLGGISNGEAIEFETAFKPVSTVMRDREGVDRGGDAVMLKAKGRHDPCVLPRAVPIVEAMTCLVLADHLLRQRTSKA